MREWEQKYNQHKYRAERRGIPFELTFKQWLKIWQYSGHLHERGHRQGQYVMALRWRQHQVTGITQGIDERVDFGGQSSARLADRLRAVFFRAPALC